MIKSRQEVKGQGIQRNETKNMILCAMFVTLIAAGAFIKIPIPVVPFTLQYLFTMLAGLLLGGKLGCLSVSVYILLGRWDRIYISAKLWLYHWLCGRRLCDGGDCQWKGESRLSAPSGGQFYRAGDCIFLWNGLLLLDE